jgi:hypothetical protein
LYINDVPTTGLYGVLSSGSVEDACFYRDELTGKEAYPHKLSAEDTTSIISLVISWISTNIMTFIASRNATETHDLQNCLPIILGRLFYTYLHPSPS